MASGNVLQEWFPNTKLPIIISAPMLGSSNGTLAAQVSKAGGFGIVPGGYDLNADSAQLTSLAKELEAARSILGLTEMSLTPAPVGVGFLTSHKSVSSFRENVLPILEKYMPQAVWLFAPDPDTSPRAQPEVIAVCHEHGFKVFVQVGTVAAAREAAQDGADVIVAQGIDAGGHQYASGAGVISLVPEVRLMLEDEFAGKQTALVAAGGIAHENAVVGAIALGADGVVMGTKFLPSKESVWPEAKKKAVLDTTDGGASTVKSGFHDEIAGTTWLWPKKYDGRAIITESYRDHSAGLPLEENQAKFKAAAESDGSRQLIWSGTGIGLVKDAIPAGDIVRNMREGANKRLQSLRYAFDDTGKQAEKDQSWVKQLGHTMYKHK
ncbi:hypothetical protein N0V93_000251 [Gnomoniopsis smithogilvyi]|uniref:2-nitropropane dioxygenase n=1 Tax=Gnomoniopsis smithogilvyi TaxID=1191159 RepID=A0A9W9D1I4_9PEZI|nr:hypothetical protein N0V93_000251 [Gnomoniopsis smithogilvyi]